MSTIALFAIARPTFDVPLAQSVADGAVAQLEAADHRVAGGRGELLMDAAAAERAVAALQIEAIDNAPDLIILLQASFADSTMAVQIARALAAYRRAAAALGCARSAQRRTLALKQLVWHKSGRSRVYPAGDCLQPFACTGR